MIIANWPESFRRQYGSVLPTSYMSIDTETSGYSHDRDVILEWGHTLVRDGMVVDRMSLLINWYDSVVPAAYLDQRLDKVRFEMQASGKGWHITPELLKAKGVPPAKALPWLFDLLTEVKQADMAFVGHNICRFDMAILCAHFRQDLRKEFVFPLNRIMDTASIEKASQIAFNPKSMPLTGETLFDYCKRVAYVSATGVKYNLEHCGRKYKLDEKHGIKLTELHGAGIDSFVVHLLFEEFRRLTAESSAARPVAVVRPFAGPSRAARGPVPEAPVDMSMPVRRLNCNGDRNINGKSSEVDRMQQELRDHFDKSLDDAAAAKRVARPVVNYRKQKVR